MSGLKLFAVPKNFNALKNAISTTIVVRHSCDWVPEEKVTHTGQVNLLHNLL